MNDQPDADVTVRWRAYGRGRRLRIECAHTHMEVSTPIRSDEAEMAWMVARRWVGESGMVTDLSGVLSRVPGVVQGVSFRASEVTAWPPL